MPQIVGQLINIHIHSFISCSPITRGRN